jgi:hypothetical protein
MSWKHNIQTAGTQWDALMEYVDERIEMHTQVCMDPERSELAIRQSQHAIAELRALQSIPQSLRAEAQIKAHSGTRKGY